MTKPANEKAENLMMRTPVSILAAVDAEVERIYKATGFRLTRQKAILHILRTHFGLAS